MENKKKEIVSGAIEEPFIYNLDSPKTGEIQGINTTVSGWIATDSANDLPNGVSICSGDKSLTLGLIERRDVEEVYPGKSAVGFKGYFFTGDFLDSKNWQVKFKIFDKEYCVPIEISLSPKNIKTFLKQKEAKLKTIKNVLLCPVCAKSSPEIVADGSKRSYEEMRCLNCDNISEVSRFSINCLPQVLKEYGGVKPTDNISAHDYDEKAQAIIKKFKNGLILDDGSGSRKTYYKNVINLEIVDYTTTDVLGIGECLPFKSNSFDAVFSLAVLEHVKDPFKCASEILRVLKPGGLVYVVVPFLQPFHGYPDHYYNMTSSGLRNLFGENINVTEDGVLHSGLPIWSLTWFLNSYLRGLPTQVAEDFRQRTVASLLEPPENYLNEPFVKELDSKVNTELASTNYIIFSKK